MVSFHVGTSVEADFTVRKQRGKQRGRPRLKPLPEASLYALLVYRITDAHYHRGVGMNFGWSGNFGRLVRQM